MLYSITFSQHGEVLTRYEFEVAKPQEDTVYIDKAYRQFKMENPRISLFDSVRVLYDKG